MKKDKKQRLFEVLSRLDKTFKPKLNKEMGGEPFRNLKYEKSTQTIRTVPENYWIATVTDDGEIIFDSWDGAIKGRVDKDYVINWFNKNVDNVSENIYKDDDPTSRMFRNTAKAFDPEGYKKRWEKKRPGEVEPETKPKVMNQFKKDLNEKRRFNVNPKYTHFAVFKDSNKIATAWEYGDIESEELRSEKKHYFYNDLVDWDIDPKSVNILSRKYLERKGINPFDWNNWESNEEREARAGGLNESPDDDFDLIHKIIQELDKMVEVLTEYERRTGKSLGYAINLIFEAADELRTPSRE